MWVKMTRNAYSALLHVTRDDDTLFAEWFYDVERTKERVLVNAPYIAWSYARDRLYRRAFGPRGGKRKVAQREFAALKAIQTELNYVDTHPALRDVGMLGWHSDMFPVWATGDSELPWSPMPIHGARFAVLTPDWREHQDGIPKSTVWVPRPSGPNRECSEAVHRALHQRATVR